MFTITQHKLDKSNYRLPRKPAGAFLVPLGFISDRLRLYKVYGWLQDEKLRYRTIRELNRLNDDYLDDVGIKKRSDIRPIVNLLMKRRRERRYRPGYF